MQHKVGDKVHVRRVENDQPLGRGQIVSLQAGTLQIRLEPSERLLVVPSDDVRNFSLAARKAWKKMPRRKVGRPKGSRVSDRVSVTLRADRELWDLFRLAESQGLIPDRTAVFNEWIANYLSGFHVRKIGFRSSESRGTDKTS
jgi:hypothetical protein